MAINFPNSPNVDDTYTANGTTWIWNGTVWAIRFKTSRIDGGTAYSVYTDEQTIDGGTASG
jgi:hypothetical protein